ncbi:MAG: hypothetical protein LBT04_01845 [Prevotellaceae bacterium]|jgi:hypothetical protein|nr:hypothetical protein [Prevotellaceae bacterium]
MFTKLKKSVGARTLKKQIRYANYKRRFHNFNTAKSIGVLYPYSRAVDSQVAKFMRFFAERHIKVRALGFLDAKELPASFIVTVNKTLFKQEHLNWYNRPSSNEINAFINTPFDILIDFSNEHIYPLQYIATLSRASMRVGRLAYPDNPYEFLLSMPTNADNQAYIDQLKHYLFSIQIK